MIPNKKNSFKKEGNPLITELREMRFALGRKIEHATVFIIVVSGGLCILISIVCTLLAH